MGGSIKLEKLYPEKIAGMRDKIIHYYFGVNYSILWEIIKEKIPELKGKVEKIIKENEEE